MKLMTRTMLFACGMAAGLAPVTALAEPFLSRDVPALGVRQTVFELGGSWAASRGGYDDEKHTLGFSQTPGTALSRDASLAIRQGISWDSEIQVAAGWAAQEVKVDRGYSASGYLGADTARGEGPTDIVITWKWAPPLNGDTAGALEAGVKIPVARGPDKAKNAYDRLGTGGFSLPVGVRWSHCQGVITGYFTGFWDIPLARNLTTWYGNPPGGRYVPGQGFWFTVGAEVRPGAGPLWAVEFAKAYTGRETGDAAFGPDLLPPQSSLTFVPSVSVPVGMGSDFHLAVTLPLEGRNVYQMFGGEASLRVRL